MGGANGGAVIQDDSLWFGAGLAGASDPSFERSHVYRFTAAAPAVAAVGTDGFVFTSRDYTPEEGYAGQRDRPENDLAAPPDAASMRAMVGMAPPGRPARPSRPG